MTVAGSDAGRSALMSRVRQAGTAPEIAVAVLLRKIGVSSRLNMRTLPGSPDFANRRRKWAIFVHGCFWHQHRGCSKATRPKANASFWDEKFVANRRRDAAAIRALRKKGFKVVVIWECETRNPEMLKARLLKIFEPRGIDVGKSVDHA